MKDLIINPQPPYSILLHFKLLDRPKKALPYIYDGVNTLLYYLDWRGFDIAFKATIVSECWSPKIVIQPYIGDIRLVYDVVRWLLRLDLNLKPYLNDEDIRGLILKWCGLRPPREASLYQALIKAILRQQVNINLATILIDRFVRRYGSKVKIENTDFHKFPNPEKVANLSVNELKAIGFSIRKARAIIEVSREVLMGYDLEGLLKLDADEAVAELMKFKGIGRWTAELAYVSASGSFRIAPYDDLAVIKGVSTYLGREVSREDIRKLYKMHPLHGLIIYYLSFLYEESKGLIY